MPASQSQTFRFRAHSDTIFASLFTTTQYGDIRNFFFCFIFHDFDSRRLLKDSLLFLLPSAISSLKKGENISRLYVRAALLYTNEFWWFLLSTVSQVEFENFFQRRKQFFMRFLHQAHKRKIVSSASVYSATQFYLFSGTKSDNKQKMLFTTIQES